MDLHLCSRRPIYLQKFDLNNKKEMVVENILFREEKERKFHIDFCAINHAAHVPARTKSTIFC